MEFGKFKRGDRDDRDDRSSNDRGGSDRPRFGDRDDRSSNDRGGFDRPRYGDRQDRGGFDRPRYGDRQDRGGSDRPRFGGGGGDRFGGGGDRNRNRYGDRGGSDRPRFGDRGGDRGDRSGGFDRDAEESVFSKKVRAGKRRTYFMDVRKTRGEDYFITITESTRREDGFGYKRHKIFLYKEDFNRFVSSLTEVVDHVKNDLMPDFDYEEFDRRQAEWEAQNQSEDDDSFEDTDAPESASFEKDDDGEHDDAAGDVKAKDDDDVSW